MTVRAKMKVTQITKSGDPKKPYVKVDLGAVYSSDPESENRSFANATPTASVSISIDAGRPAAEAFELGGEYYVDFIPCGVPERFFIADVQPQGGELDVILSKRDGSGEIRAHYKPSILSATIDGTLIEESWRYEKFIAAGYGYWRYLRESE